MAHARSRTATLTLEFAQAAVEQEGGRRHQAAEKQTLDAHLHHTRTVQPVIHKRMFSSARSARSSRGSLLPSDLK